MASVLYSETAALPVNPRAWLKTAKSIAYTKSIVDIGYFDLTPAETWWSLHYDELLSHGYLLRPRFRPGWIPSWQDKPLSPYHCEDAYTNFVRSPTRITREKA